MGINASGIPQNCFSRTERDPSMKYSRHPHGKNLIAEAVLGSFVYFYPLKNPPDYAKRFSASYALSPASCRDAGIVEATIVKRLSHIGYGASGQSHSRPCLPVAAKNQALVRPAYLVIHLFAKDDRASTEDGVAMKQ